MYKVFVDDNYNFMDESERYCLGEYSSLEEAIEACKKIVDEHLLSAFQPDMTSEVLLNGYRSFGEDPYIVSAQPTESKILFSAWDYAQHRSVQLCGPEQN